ncbi:Acyl-coenzyme A thioesterase 8 [Caenorhabditis elegans]|uniref:Acyl-coenzyme A thioesterase 8 n=1 Tax=Caenorhabditis elegans TaxID=6239 RepID=H2KYT7_CAEEL|nr:Acyl-coenzyme A thioesterase 8 [Caenorhabditis elegans]CCD64831.1 Acyl-coenzyme A thioesterase 8 [Caenorhabditis elegans]|eukprot:NP_495076.1 Uncharacterized protein CELE_C17C3.1 [Caenorhabditis elegans]
MFVKNVNWDSDIRHLEPLGNSWEVPSNHPVYVLLFQKTAHFQIVSLLLSINLFNSQMKTR